MVPQVEEKRESQDWLITDQGEALSLSVDSLTIPETPYRLYRFLTELEDILDTVDDSRDRTQAIVPLVRKLLISSYWLQMAYRDPPADPGWSVEYLYDEAEFPLTVQMVAWLPGYVSPIHNHGTWGIVAIVSGQEKHRFWQRSTNPATPDAIELVSEQVFGAGEIIAFTPGAIHSVEPLGHEAAVTFNLYGATDYGQRYEFDPINQRAVNF